MSFSIQRAVSDGTMTLLPVSIDYFDREEISVLFDGVLNARQWAWVGTTDKTLSFTPEVANTVEVMIVRSTDLAALRHQFSLGAQFTAESLDESLLQVLHIAQEAREGSNLGEIFQNLNFHGFKATNMGNGSDPGDAVNHAQMEAHDVTIVGYMNTTEGYKNAAAASASASAASAVDAADAAALIHGPSGAANVGYLPEGTGAVSTNVQNHLRHLDSKVISVTDAPFYAVCDGVADDTACVQAALDSLALTGGGCLHIPSGAVIGISETLFVGSNTRLIGEGLPVIKAITPFSGAMVQFGYTTDAVVSADTHACHHSSIEGVDVDGNNIVTGKDWDPTNSVAAALDSALVYVWRNSKYNRILNCKIHSAECDLVGAEDGSDFLEVRGNEVYDMWTTSATTQYASLMNIDGPENAIIEGNYIHTMTISGYAPASWGYGIRLHATDGAVVRDNRITAGYHNILVDGRKNLIENNNLSGSQQSGIVLYYNAFKCLYNVVIGNYIAATNRSIYEEDTGNTGYVGWNTIIGNTAINSAIDISTKGQGTTVLGNNIYSDAGVTLYPRMTILGVSNNHASSDFATGSWAPTVDNTSNVSGGAASGCRFTRIGNMVQVMGTVSFTVAATGAFELRLPLPVATTFANDYDAAGRHGDTFSVYGAVYALTGGTARLRLVGTATSTGAKTSRFTATYFIQ